MRLLKSKLNGQRSRLGPTVIDVIDEAFDVWWDVGFMRNLLKSESHIKDLRPIFDLYVNSIRLKCTLLPLCSCYFVERWTVCWWSSAIRALCVRAIPVAFLLHPVSFWLPPTPSLSLRSFRQAESGNCHSRSPGHAEASRDLPEHWGRLPVRARPPIKARPLLTRRLHLSKRYYVPYCRWRGCESRRKWPEPPSSVDRFQIAWPEIDGPAFEM